MKGYIRKYNDNGRMRRPRGRKSPAELDFAQMSVDALNRVVRKAMAVREKKAIEGESEDADRRRRGEQA